MRVIGARRDGGAMVWADAGTWVLEVLDVVVIRTPAEELVGRVVITPEQLLQPPAEVEGAVTERRPRPTAGPGCTDLPGAEMPVLGAAVQTPDGPGTISAVDAVHGAVTVKLQDGPQIELAASEVQTARDEEGG